MSNQHVQDNISDWGHSGRTARANEARLTAILDQVPGAVGLFSIEGRSLLRRGPLRHLWDAMIPSRDPVSSRRWRSFDEAGRLLPTSDYPGERALKGETVVPGIDFLHAADGGGETWYRVSAAPFRNETGEIAGAVMILQNVDKEKRSEQRLRDSEEYFRLALEAGNMGIWEWDAATQLVKADKAHQALFGLTPQAEPRPIEEYWAQMDPEESEIGIQKAKDAIENGTDIQIELRIRPSEGITRWIAVRGRPRNSGSGSIIGVALDVTDRKIEESRLEHLVDLRTRELAESNAALIAEIEERRRIAERLDLIQAELFHASRLSVAGQMAAVIAHELSQPLTATLNSVNVIRRLLASSEPGREVALREVTEEAGNEIERASEIVRRLRFYIRRGAVDRMPEPVAPMVEEAVAFAAVGPNALGVSISQYFDPLVPIVLVDRVQIQQVISNLVRNSLEAMSGQSRRKLTVTTAASHDAFLELIVSDNGSGIADEMAATLFEPFKTDKPGGMGLGLSICKSIVEAHGGRIAYEPSFDGGSVFRITLQVPSEEAMK
jgi:PAS domain S-box-containing protein